VKNLFKVSGGLLLCLLATTAFGGQEISNMGSFMKKYSLGEGQERSVVEATTELDQTGKPPAEKSATLRALFSGHLEAQPAVEYVIRYYFECESK
jgi:hypothetical protein